MGLPAPRPTSTSGSAFLQIMRNVPPAWSGSSVSPKPKPPHSLEAGTVIRMGVPPVRLEILTTISGVEFAACYARRRQAELDGVPIQLIQLDDLKRNKKASGRLKDRLDLEQLG